MSVSQFSIIKTRCLQVGEHLALNTLQQVAFRSGRLNRAGQRSLVLVNLELQQNRSYNPILSGASLVISLLFYFY